MTTKTEVLEDVDKYVQRITVQGVERDDLVASHGYGVAHNGTTRGIRT